MIGQDDLKGYYHSTGYRSATFFFYLAPPFCVSQTVILFSQPRIIRQLSFIRRNASFEKLLQPTQGHDGFDRWARRVRLEVRSRAGMISWVRVLPQP